MHEDTDNSRKERLALGFTGETPIANDLFTILENMDIVLLEYPIDSEGDKPAFSVAFMYSNENEQEFVFIGLNTTDYFDKQIFAIAHELYHFYTKSGSHLGKHYCQSRANHHDGCKLPDSSGQEYNYNYKTQF